MPVDRQKLTPESLEELVKKIKKDAALREVIIDKIKTSGVAGVLNEFFVLSDKQKDNVGKMNSVKEMGEQLSSAVLAALKTNGTIRLMPQDLTHIEPIKDVHVGIHAPGGVGVDVDIHCAQ